MDRMPVVLALTPMPSARWSTWSLAEMPCSSRGERCGGRPARARGDGGRGCDRAPVARPLRPDRRPLRPRSCPRCSRCRPRQGLSSGSSCSRSASTRSSSLATQRRRSWRRSAVRPPRRPTDERFRWGRHCRQRLPRMTDAGPCSPSSGVRELLELANALLHWRHWPRSWSSVLVELDALGGGSTLGWGRPAAGLGSGTCSCCASRRRCTRRAARALAHGP